MKQDDRVPDDDQACHAVVVAEFPAPSFWARNGANPVEWLLSLPMRFIVAIGTGVVLRRVVRQVERERQAKT